MQGRRVTNDFPSVGLLRMPPQLAAPRRCVHLCLSCELQRSYIGEPQFLHERLLRFIMFCCPGDWGEGWVGDCSLAPYDHEALATNIATTLSW